MMNNTKESYAVLCDDIKSIVDCYIEIMRIADDWCDGSKTANDAMLEIAHIILERQKSSYDKVMKQKVENEKIPGYANFVRGQTND